MTLHPIILLRLSFGQYEEISKDTTVTKIAIVKHNNLSSFYELGVTKLVKPRAMGIALGHSVTKLIKE